MPELPEVETVMRLVRPDLVGRRVEGVRVAWLRSLGGLSRAAFRGRVRGTSITEVRRRAKYIVLDLERRARAAGALLVHLRMTGRLQVQAGSTSPSPHERVRLRLDDGRALCFLDVRKFGRCVHVTDPASALGHLGPEPLEDAFSAAWLKQALRSRRRMLKPLLLDQTFLAGLGNIYVDEALFRARLHPCRRSDALGARSVVALHRAIGRVLTEAVRREGSSIDGFYRTPQGNPGSYQAQFRVYGRAGRPCRRCAGTVRRLVVGQRGTHICPRCQRPPR